MSHQTDSLSTLDLTEDDDSRGTICDVAESPQLPNYRYSEINGNIPRLKPLSPSTPPPLTPICEINYLRNQNIQHRARVPQLKRIFKSSSDPRVLTEPVHNYEPSSVGSPVQCISQSYQDKFVAYQGSTISSRSLREYTIMKNGKYYKIAVPHNVMPVFNQSNGSVLVNVPEVGPVVLKNNPNFKDPNPTIPELQPFSLNFDEIMETSTEPESQSVPVQMPTQPVNETELMFDPRFCWMQPKYRNYLYSFKWNFNGFSKNDMQKARRCVRNFTHCIKKLEYLLSGKKQDNTKSKSSKNVNKNDIMRLNNDSLNLTNSFSQIHSSDQNYLYSTSSNDWLDNTNDLPFHDVFTPNVVLNTENSTFHNQVTYFNSNCLDQVSNKQSKRRHHPVSAYRQLPNMVKHCVVKVVKDKSIENLVNQSKVPKSGILQKFKGINKNNKTVLLRIIKTETQFRSEMAYIKPLIIVNEFNFHKFSFKFKFIKNNVVYAVNKENFPKRLFENQDFLNAVKKGYVKLVDCNLLIRYLKGEIGPFNSAH